MIEERDVEIIGRVVRLFLYLGDDEVVRRVHEEFTFFCVEIHVIPVKFYVDGLRCVSKIYSELDLVVLKGEEGQEHLVIAKVKVERKESGVRRRGRVVNFLGLRVRLSHVVLPDICDEIKGLGIDLGPTYVKVEGRPGKLGHDVFALEPKTIEEIPVGRNDHGGILVRENLDEFRSLGKVFVSRVLGPEEGNTRGIRDVCVLGTLGGELNEGTRHI